MIDLMQDNLILTLISWVIGQIVVGAAIWGAIRADIRNMHKDIEETKADINKAHERIDRIYMQGALRSDQH